MRPPHEANEECQLMVLEKNLETRVPQHRRRRRIVLGVAVMLLLGAAIFLLGIGRWLVLEDPLEKAQAIAVLSGRMPLRAIEAAKLYREGYAPKVWLTHSAEPGETLKAMGISFVSEDAYNVEVLRHEGVPADAIRVLQPPIINTAD